MQFKTLLGPDHFELWLGRGRPLNPYLRFRLKESILKEMKPRDLRMTPDDLYPTEGVKDIQEYTHVRGWMQQWLKLVSWYYTSMMDHDIPLGHLFDAPVCSTSWRRIEVDEDLLRFGLLWRIYDMVGILGLDWRFPILSVLDQHPSRCFVLGGESGSDFLVDPCGLVQPHARVGIVLVGACICVSHRDVRYTGSD